MLFGFLIARYGFHLYKDGAGSGRDNAAFEAGPIKIKAQSVGSIIMGTAFLWAWAGVAISPRIDKTGDDWKVADTQSDLGLKDLTVSVPLPNNNEKIRNDPEELKKLLSSALRRRESSPGIMVISVNNKPASFDPNSIRSLKSEAGYYLIITDFRTDKGKTTLAFEPKFQGDEVVFVPSGIGKFYENDKK